MAAWNPHLPPATWWDDDHITRCSGIWVEFLYQFINRVLEVPKQISPIFCFKNPRDKCCSQGIKFDHLLHNSRSIFKDAWIRLWIKRSSESLNVWSLRRTLSPFWNRGWWNNYKLFSSRGTMRHLQNNIHITKNQVQNHKTQA